jgi:cell division protein FtsB
MDRPVAAASQPPRVALRADKLVRIFLLVCVAAAIALGISPTKNYLSTQRQAAETHRQLQGLIAEKKHLAEQGRDLSHGSGLEEQARRQGLIDPSEKLYVINGVKAP